MKSKDKKDKGKTKEGSGRVAIYKSFNCIHCYTLESNYNDGLRIHPTTAASGEGSECATPPRFNPQLVKYTPAIWREMGRASAIAMLDIRDENPWSRISTSSYGSLSGLQEHIKSRLKNDVDYKQYFPPDPPKETSPKKTVLKQAVVPIVFPPPKAPNAVNGLPPPAVVKYRNRKPINNVRSISPIVVPKHNIGEEVFNGIGRYSPVVCENKDVMRYPMRPSRVKHTNSKCK